MHRRSLVLIAILVVALLAGAGGVYAYDQGKDGEIAEGIKVNGVDVGGMSESRARRTLRAALLDPLNRPVTARFEGKRYKLTPEQAQIGVDIDGSVNRALARSRDGDIVSRTWRELRGTPILPPWGTGLATSALRAAGVRIPEEMAQQLRYGRAIDNRKLKAAGFVLRYTTREAVAKFAEDLRVRALRQDGDAPYRYEREVEEFLRYSPSVRRRGEAAREESAG